ncbi:MAG: thiosulfate sulfurtransferase GlpE [Coxiellaceae bacterium]|nr:thiosulfate sulfurtransferase GlpE [Coxiellaceae bacterium]
MSFQQYTPDRAKIFLQSTQAIVLDIRDEGSYKIGHIPGAEHMTMQKIENFCEIISKETPILVCCYHGISSQSVAQYLVTKGFATVISLVGGYEAWKNLNTSLDE